MTLLSASVNAFDEHTVIGKVAAGRRLVADEEHAVWHDGDTTQTWTLPDQPPLAGTPVLTHIVRVETWWKSPDGRVPETYLLLVDKSGRTLACLAVVTTQAGPTYEQTDLDRIWPGRGFELLQRRGVVLVNEQYPALDDLERAHPGAVSRTRMLLGSRRTAAAVWALLAIVAFIGILTWWSR